MGKVKSASSSDALFSPPRFRQDDSFVAGIFQWVICALNFAACRRSFEAGSRRAGMPLRSRTRDGSDNRAWKAHPHACWRTHWRCSWVPRGRISARNVWRHAAQPWPRLDVGNITAWVIQISGSDATLQARYARGSRQPNGCSGGILFSTADGWSPSVSAAPFAPLRRHSVVWRVKTRPTEVGRVGRVLTRQPTRHPRHPSWPTQEKDTRSPASECISGRDGAPR